MREYFDVGIAEQHAVTFAADLLEGIFLFALYTLHSCSVHLTKLFMWQFRSSGDICNG
jgi:hypothetical protein